MRSEVGPWVTTLRCNFDEVPAKLVADKAADRRADWRQEKRQVSLGRWFGFVAWGFEPLLLVEGN